jgi:hypothetical protein
MGMLIFTIAAFVCTDKEPNLEDDREFEEDVISENEEIKIVQT